MQTERVRIVVVEEITVTEAEKTDLELVEDRPKADVLYFTGVAMNETTAAAASGILAKLLPAATGAAIMIAVDTPATKREWFLRLFVAFACSWAFYGITFDFLQSLSWFSFLNKKDEDHQFAIRTLLGASGWFVMGGGAMLLKKFRADPTATIAEVKK